MLHRVIVLLCTILFVLPTSAQDVPTPDPADVASPEALVTAAYESLARAPGAPFQWDRFRSLFLPQATLVPNTEQTGGTFRVLSPEDFIAWIEGFYEANAPIGSPQDRGFAEEAVHNEVHRYGDIAQVFSTYQKRFWDDEQILGRGINSFQLVHHEDRWWIASIAWDEENGAGPIPDAYLN
ncbi:MAG: hypothetical protein R3181_08220 [Rubricoccaceae bacterium]|nr:hypothetical protein [Rubricoccaceae bacterium]